MNEGLSRRVFIAGAGAIAVAGCTTVEVPERKPVASLPPAAPAMYQALPEEQFPVPAVNIAELDRRFWRVLVDYPSDEKIGTLIVDTPNKYLYHVRPNGRAVRYGIGVGREGFAWSGRAIVAYKRAWPRWTPPDDMIARQTELEKYSMRNGGMPPGLANPLGARALYIHENGRDTLYRLHGTAEAFSIGNAVSSGCIRLLNQDVIHLHEQVRDGSPILVIPDPSMMVSHVG